jgi:hypothetical protein
MWYQDNKQLFNKKGPGFYTDYRGRRDATPQGAYMAARAKGGSTGMTRYMRHKKNTVGFVYPMMVFKGALSKSILSSSAPGAVCVIEPRSITLGTDIKYAIYHQLGGDKMPYRPIIINKTVKGNYTEIFKNRVANYTRLIDTYVSRHVKSAFGRG